MQASCSSRATVVEEAQRSMGERIDWHQYRVLCDRPDVVSRWLLDQSAALLMETGEELLAGRLREALAAAPLGKPIDHKGGAATDFFVPQLSLAEVQAIATRVRAMAEEPRRRLASGRGLGGMPEAWLEYCAWLDGTHPRSPNADRALAADDATGRI